MTTTEIVANKIQEILGSKYEVKPFGFFAQSYIKPMMTPYGQVYDINFETFEKYDAVIPASVSVQETTPINSNLFYRTGILTINFYVPIDNKDITFFADYEKLRYALANGRVALQADDTLYKAYFTLGEPSTNGSIQSTGAYKRMLYTVQGNVTVIDNKYKTGDDYRIAIYDAEHLADNYGWVEFENITNLSVARDATGNAVQDQDTTLAQSPIASRVHSVSFNVTDTDSDAVNIVRKAVFGMTEIVSIDNSAQTEAQEREVRVRLYYDDTSIIFRALLSASYSVANKAGVGTYTVTLTRTDDDTQVGADNE